MRSSCNGDKLRFAFLQRQLRRLMCLIDPLFRLHVHLFFTYDPPRFGDLGANVQELRSIVLQPRGQLLLANFQLVQPLA